MHFFYFNTYYEARSHLFIALTFSQFILPPRQQMSNELNVFNHQKKNGFPVKIYSTFLLSMNKNIKNTTVPRVSRNGSPSEKLTQ